MASTGLEDVRLPFDQKGLEAYLNNLNTARETTFGVTTPKFQLPLTVKQFKFGQSNPTYYLKDTNGLEFVLRRKPVPNEKLVSKSAHAIEREFFILRAIEVCNQKQNINVPVPNVYLLCEDESVIGYVFYLMQYVKGRQMVNPALPDIPESERKLYWDSIMQSLLAIHSLDDKILILELPKKHFPQFQPKEGEKSNASSGSYFERQIKTLTAIAKGQSKVVDPIPNFDKICTWLLKNAPKDPTKRTLIHGDFKIDNLIFDQNEPKVIAILDWELCTIGHPLFDLANLLQPFLFPTKFNKMMFNTEVEFGSEFSTSRTFISKALDLYSEKLHHRWDESDPSNNPKSNYRVGIVFGFLRLCVISQGIRMREKKGNASSSQAHLFGSLYPLLSDLAMLNIKDVASKL